MVARQSRQSAGALEVELDRSLELIAHQPEAGLKTPTTQFEGVRRVLLKRVRYHLFYRVNAKARVIEVLALWHTSRDDDPQM